VLLFCLQVESFAKIHRPFDITKIGFFTHFEQIGAGVEIYGLDTFFQNISMKTLIKGEEILKR
jgi:hypothetical protein